MTPSTPTLSPTEPVMWRKLLAVAHPDKAGDHELFIWTMKVRELVCSGADINGGRSSTKTQARDYAQDQETERIPFDSTLDFTELTHRAVLLAAEVDEPYASLLRALAECPRAPWARGDAAKAWCVLQEPSGYRAHGRNVQASKG